VDFNGEYEFIARTMKCPMDPDNLQWEINSYKFQILRSECPEH